MNKYLNRSKAFNIKLKMNSFPTGKEISKVVNGITYINSEQSKLIDEELMEKDIGYGVEQLMEISGLSVAQAIHHSIDNQCEWKGLNKILNISGPGNNGGDGLIASRYLKEFGYDVSVYYPKKTEKELYLKLIKQCNKYSIPFVDDNVIDHFDNYDLIIDSVFGFSFKGDIRSPFDKIIKALNETNVKIASVDVPSGWNVDKGNTLNTFTPKMLISLTLPKLGVAEYSGIHYLAGRFVPSALYDKLHLQTPKYQGSEMFKLL